MRCLLALLANSYLSKKALSVENLQYTIVFILEEKMRGNRLHPA